MTRGVADGVAKVRIEGDAELVDLHTLSKNTRVCTTMVVAEMAAESSSLSASGERSDDSSLTRPGMLLGTRAGPLVIYTGLHERGHVPVQGTGRLEQRDRQQRPRGLAQTQPQVEQRLEA